MKSVSKRKPKGYWTYERCAKAARKCKNRSEFKKKYLSAWRIACKNKWMDKLFEDNPSLSGIKLDTIGFIDRSRLIHGNRYDYSKSFYETNITRIKIICPQHGAFYQMPCSHMSGKGCRECANVKLREERIGTTESFIKKAQVIHRKSYDYNDVLYKGALIKVDIKCKIHGSFSQAPSKHLSGRGCPTCGIDSMRLPRVNSIDSLRNIARKHHGELITNLYSGRNSYYTFQCKFGHIFTSRAGNILYNNNWCPICNESRGERRIFNTLNDLICLSEREKRFPNCVYKRQLRFDFFLPEYNVIIEFDGEQHFSIRYNSIFQDLTEVKLRDEIKNQFCKDNRIKLIRIPYTKINDIETILTREHKNGFPRSINYSAKLLN